LSPTTPFGLVSVVQMCETSPVSPREEAASAAIPANGRTAARATRTVPIRRRTGGESDTGPRRVRSRTRRRASQRARAAAPGQRVPSVCAGRCRHAVRRDRVVDRAQAEDRGSAGRAGREGHGAAEAEGNEREPECGPEHGGRSARRGSRTGAGPESGSRSPDAQRSQRRSVVAAGAGPQASGDPHRRHQPDGVPIVERSAQPAERVSGVERPGEHLDDQGIQADQRRGGSRPRRSTARQRPGHSRASPAAAANAPGMRACDWPRATSSPAVPTS